MMAQSLTWDDVEDIAILLHEQAPRTDPVTVRFTDLLVRVCALPDFVGDRAQSSEAKLEAVQMAWLDEYRDANA